MKKSKVYEEATSLTPEGYQTDMSRRGWDSNVARRNSNSSFLLSTVSCSLVVSLSLFLSRCFLRLLSLWAWTPINPYVHTECVYCLLGAEWQSGKELWALWPYPSRDFSFILLPFSLSSASSSSSSSSSSWSSSRVDGRLCSFSLPNATLTGVSFSHHRSRYLLSPSREMVKKRKKILPWKILYPKSFNQIHPFI